MNQKQAKTGRKEVRKLIGVDGAWCAMKALDILQRGFWGRLKWLVLGR